MKNSIEDKEKLANKLSDEDKTTIEDAIKETKEWLGKNDSADKEAFEEKLKEIEGICNPIVSKVYKDSKSTGAGSEGSADGESDEDAHDDL